MQRALEPETFVGQEAVHLQLGAGLDLNQRPLGYERIRDRNSEPHAANFTHVCTTPSRTISP